MEPNLKKNDVVFVKKCNEEELKEGDIIAFKKEAETITHRIVEIKSDNNNNKYITKGDNNKVVDNFEIDYEQIYGKVIFKIEKFGKFVQYIQNIKGMINVIIIIFVVYLWANMRDKKKNYRKIKRRKYEIKKLRDNYK